MDIMIVFMGLGVGELRGVAVASMLYLALHPRLYTSWMPVCDAFESAAGELSLLS